MHLFLAKMNTRYDGAVYLRIINTRSLVTTFHGHDSSVVVLAFMPDGTVRVWGLQ